MRSTRAFSRAFPMYSTPSPPDHLRRYCCVRSSLRSPRRNDTTSMPLRSAYLLIAPTNRCVIGAISTDDGTLAPRTLRKKYAAPGRPLQHRP